MSGGPRLTEDVLEVAVGGHIEILVDERSRFVKPSLSRDHELIYC